MYYIYLDNHLIYRSEAPEVGIYNAKITLKENSTQSFEYSMIRDCPFYNSHHMLTSIIEVYRDTTKEDYANGGTEGNLLFKGRPIKEECDFYNDKKVTCEGALGYLYDSIQRPNKFTGKGINEILETLIKIHNSQVEDYKKFKIGDVTVIDTTDDKTYSGGTSDDNDATNAYKIYNDNGAGTSTNSLTTNYETTFDAINSLLINNLAGYLDVRIDADGTMYLDYLKDYRPSEGQIIEFGTNLLDFSSTLDYSNICTGVLALGGTSDDNIAQATEAGELYNNDDLEDNKLKITNVNNGSDILWASTDVINNFGKIVKKVEWSAITDENKLLEKAKKYLTDKQYENLTLNCKLVDLHYVNNTYKPLHFLHMVKVISKPHGMNRELPISEMTIDLMDPSQNTVTLGHTINSLSYQLAQNSSSLSGVHSSIETTNNALSNNKEVYSSNLTKTNEKIATKVDQKDYDDNNNTIRETYSTIEQTNEKIATKVDKKDYDDNNNTIREKYSDIKQTVDSIDTRVGDKTVKDQIESYTHQTVESYELGFSKNGQNNYVLKLTAKYPENSDKPIERNASLDLTDLSVKASNINFDSDTFNINANGIMLSNARLYMYSYKNFFIWIPANHNLIEAGASENRWKYTQIMVNDSDDQILQTPRLDLTYRSTRSGDNDSIYGVSLRATSDGSGITVNGNLVAVQSWVINYLNSEAPFNLLSVDDEGRLVISGDVFCGAYQSQVATRKWVTDHFKAK